MPRKLRLAALTTEQQAQLPVIRDKWLAIGLATDRADRSTAEEGVRLAYAAANLPPPSTVIWLDSPMAGAIGYAYLMALRQALREKGLPQSVGDSVWDSVGASVRASVGDSVRDSVWASVRDSVWASVRDSVGDSVWDSVWDSVRDSVWASVGDSVRDSVWASVGDSVRDSVGASVRASVGDSVRASVGASVGDSVRDSVWAAGYGQHDASWLGFYDTFAQFGLPDLVAPLTGLTRIAESSGWFWPFAGAVILTERPARLRRDDRGRLHSEDGAALQYPDGWGIYAWHGVRVAEAIIVNPSSITVGAIRAEQNSEIRRVMLTRYGEGRYLQDIGAVPIHADEFGTLYRAELPGDEPLVCVSVLNSTPEPDGSRKPYMLRVPPEIRTAHEAVAWTFNKTPEEYRPLIET
jgi:hypothetical protein